MTEDQSQCAPQKFLEGFHQSRGRRVYDEAGIPAKIRLEVTNKIA